MRTLLLLLLVSGCRGIEEPNQEDCRNPGVVHVDSIVIKPGLCIWYGNNNCTFDGTYWTCLTWK